MKRTRGSNDLFSALPLFHSLLCSVPRLKSHRKNDHWSLGWSKLKASCTIGRYPIGSMGLVYLPTFTIKNQPNVGKYAIHGAYGSYGYVIFS